MRRVLIISNNSLNSNTANGILLKSCIKSFSSKEVITLSIDARIPDKNIGLAHFKITDKERFASFFNGKHQGCIITNKDISSNENTMSSKHGKAKFIKESDFGLFVREYIWKHGKWNKNLLYNFINLYKPDSILYQCSRTIFMNDLVKEISSKFNIPVFIYTGEDEVFHTYPFYRILKRILQDKLIKSYSLLNTHVSIYMCTQPKLTELYSVFDVPTQTIFPGIEIPKIRNAKYDINGPLVYFGNIQPNRSSTLFVLSKILQNEFPEKMIHIYCPDLTTKITKKIKKYSNIKIMDVVKPSKQYEIYDSASAILHIESFKKRDKILIQNGFSTKIPFALSSNRPFIVVAPDYCGFSLYFKQNADSICYISNLDNVDYEFKKVFCNPNFISNLVSNQYNLVRKNHTINYNSVMIKNNIFKGDK